MMSIFDAATGVASAGELLDKDDEELTFRDKASAGFAGFLSGLTFGLVDKKATATYLSGNREPVEVDNSLANRKRFRSVGRTIEKGDTLNAEMTNTTALEKRGNTIITNNNVAAPVNNNNLAKSETLLPHMANKNTDKTVIEIQGVY